MSSGLSLTAIRFPLVQMGKVTVQENGGLFTFNATTRVELDPPHELLEARYTLRQIRFSCDANELDYQTAIISAPKIRLYQTGLGNAPVFREAIPFPSYGNLDIEQGIDSRISPDRLILSIEGVLDASLALVGKTTLSAFVTLYFDVGSQNVR